MLRDRYGKELGEPELGFLLVCSSDFPFVEGFGADMRLANHARRHPLRFSLQAAARPIVAFGLFASLRSYGRHFRPAPINRHQQTCLTSPVRAKRGHDEAVRSSRE
jgi:hypothetical protein